MYVKVAEVDTLREKERLVVKAAGRQILLIQSGKEIYALNNRCPHEGYPLKVGTLTEGCVLTCNWHNWKFDLDSGRTLVGGDKLRRYPAEVRNGHVFIDVSELPQQERIDEALKNLRAAFFDYDYARIARELARLQKAGADENEGIANAFRWAGERYEFGMTHAQAVAADWLWLRTQRRRGISQRLVASLEPIAHLSWDALRHKEHPFSSSSYPFDAYDFVAAIESEQEDVAIGMARSALEQSDGYALLEKPLAHAALAHYQGFGHAVIYTSKTRDLIDALGQDMASYLVLPLIRSFVYSRREDLIPEFRFYHTALQKWGTAVNEIPAAEDFKGLAVRDALKLTVSSGDDMLGIYHTLLGASAYNMLHFDSSMQDRPDGPINENVGWLSFTHSITFANAVRALCTRHPELWPQGLLQMACFVGRNVNYLDHDLNEEPWFVDQPLSFVKETLDSLFDLDYGEHIVGCHFVKTAVAIHHEVAAFPTAPWVPTLVGALNRLLHSPLRRRNPTRTARQMMRFVRNEG